MNQDDIASFIALLKEATQLEFNFCDDNTLLLNNELKARPAIDLAKAIKTHLGVETKTPAGVSPGSKKLQIDLSGLDLSAAMERLKDDEKGLSEACDEIHARVKTASCSIEHQRRFAPGGFFR